MVLGEDALQQQADHPAAEHQDRHADADRYRTHARCPRDRRRPAGRVWRGGYPD
jgi:hypothetical protein